jgi:hypothetical protein
MATLAVPAAEVLPSISVTVAEKLSVWPKSGFASVAVIVPEAKGAVKV